LLGAGAASALHAAASNFKPGFATAKESAEAIRLKKISATELPNATFQRIDLYKSQVLPAHHAVASLVPPTRVFAIRIGLALRPGQGELHQPLLHQLEDFRKRQRELN
jgi:hypothetical protein